MRLMLFFFGSSPITFPIPLPRIYSKGTENLSIKIILTASLTYHLIVEATFIPINQPLS